MTRLFLAAGVAALAIAAPATAKPGGGHGGGGPQGGQQQQAQAQPHGGGHGHGGNGGGAAPQMQRGGGGGGFVAVQHGRGHGGGGFAAPQMQRQQSFAAPRQERGHGGGAKMMRVQQVQNRGFERQQLRANRMQQAQNHGFERQQLRANRSLERQQLRTQQTQNRGFDRQQLRANNMQQLRRQALTNQQLNGQFLARNGKLDGNAQTLVREQQRAYRQALSGTRFAALNYGAQTQFLAPTVVDRFVGMPVATVSSYAALSPLPASIQYLYPATSDYYYQYGDGYLYQVNRGTNLIASLLPLLAGGYLPGQYLPTSYMSSYVPASYGFNSFYPDYGGICNRYGYGVVYQVECNTGFVQDVIPLYAGGYGVGQMLPSSYAYYNVPYQYRQVYYDTPNYNYWYAPGAIYQYDPRSSMITSVAALLSPGFAVNQPLPMGYDAYNVPYAYRATYYDTPTAWYRYNNGYIYQVDPVSRVVTAIVASLLV